MPEHAYVLPSVDLLSGTGTGTGTTCRLADFLAAPAMRSDTSPLAFPVGQISGGQLLSSDLMEIGHLLVGGSIGSGVTTFLESLLVSLLMRCTPNELRMVLVDPLMTYLTAFEGVPHLITPIISQPTKAVIALSWLAQEQDRRYADMQAANTGHIRELNEIAQARGDSTYPFIVIVVSEFSDLMLTAAREVEDAVVHLALMGVPAGIHLVLATRRPSGDVLTGLIRTSIPSRLSFATRSAIDSRVILGVAGAEELTGKGDGLLSTGVTEPRRLRGAYVAQDGAVVAAARAQAEADYIDGVTTRPSVHEPIDDEIGDDTELFLRAVALVVEAQVGSPALLERTLRVGSAKALRLIELLVARRILAPGGR